MVSFKTVVSLFAAMMLVVGCAAISGEYSSTEIAKLKEDVENLRKQLNQVKTATPAKGSVERAMDKYGPDANVTTKMGKLTMSGLLQVWYLAPQTDRRGLFDGANGGAILDSNDASDNNTFRIRRTELRFTMEIHENVTAVIMIDPAREAASFYGYPDNQSSGDSPFKRINNVAPEYDAANGPGLGSTETIANVQTGAGAAPRLLQDAYINYHGVVPHHDFTIGQFLPAVGEEGIRSNAELEFVERSMVGLVNAYARDLGASLHGRWWDDRFQYWLGMFDGAGNYYLSAGQQANRADDNDAKDLNFRFLVRPLWDHECMGSLELGFSGEMGKHGKQGNPDPITDPVNGLNRRSTWASKYAPWVYYRAPGPAKGLWLRAEGLYIKDRNAPDAVVDFTGSSASSSPNVQDAPRPFSSIGWYGALGYKISDSVFCDKAPAWLKPFEFAARLERFQNVEVADLVDVGKTDVYFTTVVTGGINYYIRKNNAKIQLNYSAVKDPTSQIMGFHDVKNNVFAANFQVAF